VKLVVLRRCPSCGGGLLAAPGVAWTTCRECPSAWDLHAEPPERIPTYRPKGDADPAAVRLPFYLFGVRAPEGERLVWVPAFLGGETQGSAVAAALTERQHRVELAEAPLGAAVGRGPREARALLRHVGTPEDQVSWQALLSISFRGEGGTLVEPVSGKALVAAALFPPPR
jgi:hypothetical protein